MQDQGISLEKRTAALSSEFWCFLVTEFLVVNYWIKFVFYLNASYCRLLKSEVLLDNRVRRECRFSQHWQNNQSVVIGFWFKRSLTVIGASCTWPCPLQTSERSKMKSQIEWIAEWELRVFFYSPVEKGDFFLSIQWISWIWGVYVENKDV